MHSKKQICTPIVRWRLYHISRKSGIDFNNILDGVFVMTDQKRENLLNLALAATEVERRRVPELSAGYNSYSKTWEVIVQYQGDLAFLEGQGVRVTLLLFSYAILLVPESLMDYVTGLPQITYLEKPKLLPVWKKLYLYCIINPFLL